MQIILIHKFSVRFSIIKNALIFFLNEKLKWQAKQTPRKKTPLSGKLSSTAIWQHKMHCFAVMMQQQVVVDVVDSFSTCMFVEVHRTLFSSSATAKNSTNLLHHFQNEKASASLWYQAASMPLSLLIKLCFWSLQQGKSTYKHHISIHMYCRAWVGANCGLITRLFKGCSPQVKLRNAPRPSFDTRPSSAVMIF